MKRVLLIIFFSITFQQFILPQTPTVQDCAGAIPICQDIYHENNSFSGTGNYPNEINYPQSCTYETYSVWYTFQAQTSGNFSFILTPNNTSGLGDDYDWTVFNLTNATCANIYNDPSLEISCNSWGDLNGFNGQTGASTAMGGSGTYNGPGNLNGPPFNQDIPVTAGNIYVMMVSNWSGSPYGYTIDFSSSSAQIYDNIPPHIESIISSIGCGSNTITFQFSENILCSTIAACDITLTGPGGPYTVTNLTGTNCAAGGTQERIFTITLNQPITASGTYNLNLDASACNSVTDLCGNIAPSGSLPFTITAITANTSTVNATCGQNNGSATVSASGGSGSFTYAWSTSPAQHSQTATNLGPGNYTVTVNDGSCTAMASSTITNIGGITLQTTSVNEMCGQANGSATVTASGGVGAYTYQWSTIPLQTTTTATNLSAGTYYVTVSDGTCSNTDTVIIQNIATLNASISNIVNEDCGMSDGSATVTVNGGTQPITYQWNSSPAQTTATASNLPAGIYTVTVNDANGCSVSLNAVIVVVNYPVASVNTIMAHCDQPDGSASATVSGGTGNYTYLWNTGETTASISGLSPGVYTVTVDDGHCDTIVSVNIANTSGPTADFTYHPNPITIDNAQITFSSTTENATSWEWNFGDGTGSGYGESIFHQYYVVGTYIVSLIVTDSYGCNDTISQEVIVHDIFTIYIPNSFTPDGDGLNDVFQAYGISWEDGTYEMIIYNRWGNIVYQTTDPTKPWNGGYNNSPDRNLMIPSTYVYQITVKGFNYRKMMYIGKVTLIK